MIISHARRFILFSAPKTGSESLRALCATAADQDIAADWRARNDKVPFYPHMPPAEAKAAFEAKGWDWDTYLRLSVLRHPQARLVSLYRMIRAVDGIWRWRSRAGHCPSFPTWLRRSQAEGPGGGGRPHQKWRRFGTYSARAWGFSADGTPLVTHFLRLERLEDDLAPLRAHLGIGVTPIPRLNARDPVNWRAWYDAELAALVAARYRWEIEQFDYVLAQEAGNIRPPLGVASAPEATLHQSGGYNDKGGAGGGCRAGAERGSTS